MLNLTHIDTACALLEIGGWRLVTDPVFDAPGGRYHFGWGALSRKQSTPALRPDQLGPIDAVLLSHHQHGDNLDAGGAAFARSAPVVVTTRAAARTLSNAIGLAPGDTHVLTAPGRSDLHITAVHAQHRPAFMPEFISGPVIGFVLRSDVLPSGAVYITGDTVLCDAVRAAVATHKVHTLVVHVGAVRFPWLTGPLRYTFNATEAAEVAHLSGAANVVPIHTSGWTHFREGIPALLAACETKGVASRLRVPVSGERLTVSV